ncbi:MAG: nitrate ABC transporter substrate-binding protein [Planctomycetes bacterium]|nr:nitrate ABC transporter substrate-binding protein [Planctomycetota bacterium]
MLRAVRCRTAALALAVLAAAGAARALADAVDYVKPVKPFVQRLAGSPVGNVSAGGTVRVPYITWGGDVVTLFGNGGLRTAPGSVFGGQGLDLELVQQDDFVAQVKDYVSGKSPYLRGTLGMIHCASEALAKNPGARPIVVLQLTWSSGGDCLVVRPGVNQVKDIKGKRVVLQQYSPHLDYLDVLLRDSGLTWQDIDARFVSEITAPKGDTGGKVVDPANAFRQDPGLDAAFVISPDASALTSGGKVGTGAEDSVKGARVLVSTKSGSHIIADVYAVRSDFFQARRAEVQKFVLGYLQAGERLAELRKDAGANDRALKDLYTMSAQHVFGSPQATADVQGLLADCTVVGFGGNVEFFRSEGNLQNFVRTSARIQSFLVREGYLTAQHEVAAADWKYDDFKAGLKDTAGVAKSLFGDSKSAQLLVEKKTDSTILFEFQINFEPNEKEFNQNQYEQDYQRVLDLSSRYAGAVIEVVGHSDPLKVRKLEKEGASPAIVEQTRQAAKNLSLTRANRVRDSLVEYARKKNITFDPSQFVTNGHGSDKPLYPSPQTKEEWRANMRVVFRVINVEAEMSEFEAIGGPGAGGS